MDENPTPQDTTTEEPVQDTPVEEPEQTTVEEPTTVPEPATEPTPEVEEEEEALPYQGPGVPQLNFNNLPANEDGYLDPNTLAGAINQANAQTFEAARTAARNEYQEQRTEEKSWEKAYDKHPELKENKELRDLVQNSRIGAYTDAMSRVRSPEQAQSVKLQTPTQVAEKLFKHLATEKAAGMKQATENTVIQASAHVETAGRRSDNSENRSKLYQNINNANKEVAKKARSALLKNMLFSD